MNKPKQATLFQSWGNAGKSSQSSQNKNQNHGMQDKPGTSGVDHQHETIHLLDDDEEDQELARALEESLAYHQNSLQNVNTVNSKDQPVAGTSATNDDDLCNEGDISFGIEEQDQDHGIDRNHCLSQWTTSDQPVGDLPGFDATAGRLWIYPTNYPVREYQFTIVKQALLKNTLVTLPTGLGKTFIASVIMYNFYRWYPEGKVIFMAPTKPLVAQQIDACYHIMGIPREDTAEMTGSMNPTDRQKAWRDRRVFFLTPQVMTNDLSRGSCPAESVKCLVVDEAHKALGNHAYCQVVRELVKYTQQFRVLALSATPGSDIKSVQNVISNLAISHIELRSEESPDIKPYTHERVVEKMVIPLGEELTRIKDKYTQVLSFWVKRLVHQRVLYNREPASLSKFLILKAREAFRQNPPESLPRNQNGIVEGDFALTMSLYHGYELLQLHGLTSLYKFLGGIVSGEKSNGRTRTELMKNPDFNDVMNILRNKFQPDSDGVLLAGHPKMVRLEEVVVDHFNRFQAEGQATRVMIFSQYRDSVQEITGILQQHAPLVKVMSFIGQSSVGKATKGFTQKEQLKVMQDFRTGEFNTLVSTCVGEEGLDIGDVDLIVCFDAHKSPIRLVQRMGRTGRKRQGRIVMLVTEGKEEQIYNTSQYTKRSIHRAILNGARSLVFYANNPRMLPAEVTPACHKMHITVQAVQQKDKKQNNAQSKGKGKGQVQHGRLPKLFARGKAANKKSMQDDGGITLEEFAELKTFGTDVVSKVLPGPRMIALQSADKDVMEDDDSGQLDLAEWLPWQNSLQQTSLFGHSRRTQHFVDLLEFTDLQEMLPENEDNYGQEMRLYLDMEDVVVDPKRPTSNNIAQFVVASPRNSDSRISTENDGQHKKAGESGKANKTKQRKTTGKVRRSRLQPLEFEQDSDSDFLPDVNITSFASGNTSDKKQRTSASFVEKQSCLGVDEDSAQMEVSPAHRKQTRLKSASAQSCSNLNDEDGSDVELEDDDAALPADGCDLPSLPELTNIHTSEDFFLPLTPSLEEVSQCKHLTVEAIMAVDIEAIVEKCLFLHHTMVEVEFGPFTYIPRKPSEVDSESDSVLEHSHKPENSCEGKEDIDEICIVHDKAETCSIPQQNQPVLSQAEPKSKKPLFKPAEMREEYFEGSEAEQNSVAGSENKGGTRTSFMYSFSQGFSQTASHKNPTDSVASSKTTENYQDNKHCSDRTSVLDTAVETALGQDGSNTNGSVTESKRAEKFSSDWVTGRQVLQAASDKKKTFRPHGSSFHNTSLSDSLLLGELEEVEHGSRVNANKPHCLFNTAGNQALDKAVNVELGEKSSVAQSTWSPSPRSTAVVLSPPTPTSSASGQVNKNDSLFSFTQALACVHSNPSPEPHHNSDGERLHFDDHSESKTEGISGGNDKQQQNIFLESSLYGQVTEEEQLSKPLSPAGVEEESPNFDLGFDFDEDIIPPSPEAETTTLQLSSKVVGMTKSVSFISKASSSVARKQKPVLKDSKEKSEHPFSVSYAERLPSAVVHKEENAEHKENEYVAGLDDFDDDDLFHIVDENMEQDSPCFTSSFQSEPVPTFGNAASTIEDKDITNQAVSASSCLAEAEDENVVDNLPVIRKRKHSDSDSFAVQGNVSTNKRKPFTHTSNNSADAEFSLQAHVTTTEGKDRNKSQVLKKSSLCSETFWSDTCQLPVITKRHSSVGSDTSDTNTTELPVIKKRTSDAGDANLCDQPAINRNSSIGADAGDTNACEQPVKRKLALNPASKKKRDYRESDLSTNFSHRKSLEQNPETSKSSSQGFVCHKAPEAGDFRVENELGNSRQSVHRNLVGPSEKVIESSTGRDNMATNEAPAKQTTKPQLRLSAIGQTEPDDADDFQEDFEDFVPNFALNADLEDDFDDDFELEDRKDMSTSVKKNTDDEFDREEIREASTFTKKLFVADIGEDEKKNLEEDKEKDGAVLPKTPFLTGKFGRYHSTPLSSAKRASYVFSSKDRSSSSDSSSAMLKAQLIDEDDDFEESLIIRKPKKSIKQLSFNESTDAKETSDGDNSNAKEQFKVPVKKMKKKKKRGCAFLDNEAEMSDDIDVSSDEADDDLDLLEGSFIDNDTEMTQASQIDMQAVYMKSVRSPAGHSGARGGKYRLQYDYAYTNVYSQLPRHEEEESQYQEDSFCVGSDEEESMYEDSDAEEQSEEEEEESLIAEIRKKKDKHKTERKKKQQPVRAMKGRKRLHQLADSSSNDDDDDFDRLPATQVITAPGPKKAKGARVLLSSSEDNPDTSVGDFSPAPKRRLGNLSSDTSASSLKQSSTSLVESEKEQSKTTEESPKYLSRNLTVESSEKVKSSQGFQVVAEENPYSNHCELGNVDVVVSSNKDTMISTVSENSSAAGKRESSSVFLSSHPVQEKTVSHSGVGRETNPSLGQIDVVQKSSLLSKPVESTSALIKSGSGDSWNNTGSGSWNKSGQSRNTTDSTVRRTVSYSVVSNAAKPSGSGIGGCSRSAAEGINEDVDTLKSRQSDVETREGDGNESKRLEAEQSEDAKFTSIAAVERGKQVILVDSREISGAQDIISALRLQYNAQICTRQLAACDYILSNRMAVDRVNWSMFSNGANRNKVTDRLRQMQSLYDRCVIIVETDRVKPGEEKQAKAKQRQYSKYVETLLAQLLQTSVRTYFTENQGESAKLLSELTALEHRKKMGILAPVNLSPQKEQVVKFYLSIPRLTVVHALNLCFNFRTIHEFITSSVNGIQTKGHMSFARATEVANFVRRRFSAALMSSKS